MNFLDDFLILIQNNEFKCAHEILEPFWKECKQNSNKSEELLLKALINGATSLELLRLGRKEASLKAWNVLEKYSYHLEFISTEKAKVYTCALKKLTQKKERYEKGLHS